MGTALAAALLGISLGITEKMARELRSYGAHVLVAPESAGLQAVDDLLSKADLHLWPVWAT